MGSRVSTPMFPKKTEVVKKETDALKLIPKFARALAIRSDAILQLHANPPAEITVAAIDNLIKDTLELDAAVDGIKEVTTILNKAIMSLESKAGAYLKALEREDYVSPYGEAKIVGKWRVSLPQSDEDKMLLFEHLKARKIFEKYATVNSNSLNSLFMADWEAAKKKDAEAAVMFSMPGVPDPKFDEFTQIKATKKSKLKKENE